MSEPPAAVPPRTPAPVASVGRAVAACALYGTSSVAITFFNKAVFSVFHFHYPVFMTLVQILFCLAALRIANALGFGCGWCEHLAMEVPVRQSWFRCGNGAGACRPVGSAVRHVRFFNPPRLPSWVSLPWRSFLVVVVCGSCCPMYALSLHPLPLPIV